LLIVETILHVGIEVGGDVQEQLAVRGKDLQALWEGLGLPGFGGTAAAGVVETKVEMGIAVLVEADAQEHFAGGCVHEGNRCSWPSTC